MFQGNIFKMWDNPFKPTGLAFKAEKKQEDDLRHELQRIIDTSKVYFDAEEVPVGVLLETMSDKSVTRGDYCAQTVLDLRDVLVKIIRCID